MMIIISLFNILRLLTLNVSVIELIETWLTDTCANCYTNLVRRAFPLKNEKGRHMRLFLL